MWPRQPVNMITTSLCDTHRTFLNWPLLFLSIIEVTVKCTGLTILMVAGQRIMFWSLAIGGHIWSIYWCLGGAWMELALLISFDSVFSCTRLVRVKGGRIIDYPECLLLVLNYMSTVLPQGDKAGFSKPRCWLIKELEVEVPGYPGANIDLNVTSQLVIITLSAVFRIAST